jgi:large subunit ribosomal protein L15
MELHNLKPKRGATKNRKRIARGEGSRGGTSTRGNKGAQARTGYQAKRGFEGGQMPLHKRIPKFGFKNINRVEFWGINIDVIAKMADDNKVNVVTKEFLVNHGLAQKKDRIKILGRGSDKISKAYEITADAFSETAKNAIVSNNGKANITVLAVAAPKETTKKSK